MKVLNLHRRLAAMLGSDLQVKKMGGPEDYTDDHEKQFVTFCKLSDYYEPVVVEDNSFTIEVEHNVLATKLCNESSFIPCLDVDSLSPVNLIYVIEKLLDVPLVKKGHAPIHIFKTDKGFHFYIMKAVKNEYFDAWLKIAKTLCDDKWFKFVEAKNYYLRFTAKTANGNPPQYMCTINVEG